MNRGLLLTGSTGLLGSWLIRDLLQRGRKFALLVRRSRTATVRERVEQIVRQWEQRAGYALPRPMVIEGDLKSPDLGIQTSDRHWISANCDTVLHSAAVLTFESKGRDAEPWLTNVQGVERLLEFCRTAGIPHLHHVSTAYVCGLRRGPVMENELDVGQEHGNDYERSKAEAERLIEAADFLKTRTVYRPAIIFGDSRTGFTTTFHGLYVPLKIVSILFGHGSLFGLTPEQLKDPAVLREGARHLVDLMGLTGEERKNLVPVDWVSTMILEILDRPELHGQTYHLTSREPVTVATIQEAILSSFSRNLKSGKGQRFAEPGDWSQFQEQYIGQMGMYRSYWRDDPIFDTSNSTRAISKHPCPAVDSAMLERTCEFALRLNFWQPRHQLNPDDDVQRLLETNVSKVKPDGCRESHTYVGLTVNGLGGGEWELASRGDKVFEVRPGLSERCVARAYMNSWTLGKIRSGHLTARGALTGGRLVVEGSATAQPALADLIQNLATQGLAKETTAT